MNIKSVCLNFITSKDYKENKTKNKVVYNSFIKIVNYNQNFIKLYLILLSTHVYKV